MHLHEYQSKQVLKKYLIPMPAFGIAGNEQEAEKVVEELGLSKGVVKIQVHAGGRGKQGGVKLAKNKEEIVSFAKQLIGMKLINNQTGPEGLVSQKVLISEAASIQKEYYLAMLLDRSLARPILIASSQGGVDIEQVAENNPNQILKLPISLDGCLYNYQLLHFTNFMGWKNDLAKQGALIAQNLAKAFTEIDASLIEINPLVQTDQNQLLALDAKITIDDNALFRQKEMIQYFDATQVSKSEAAAKEFDLAYIAMEGEIGCMVNGAGLAMATMDIIHLHGKRPANFLDVGGGASKDKVAAGFRIILSDPKVKSVLVNIFGGIMNCEILAEGILQAARELNIHVPIIVRMEGTNVEKGRTLLKESNLKIQTAKDLDDAAKKAVEASWQS